MDIFSLIGLLITLVTAITYVNECTLRVPLTIAVTICAMIISIMCLLIGTTGYFPIDQYAHALINKISFQTLLLNGLLGPLLFAGSFTLDLSSMKKHAKEIASLSMISTLLSAVLVTMVTHYLCRLFGLQLPWVWCFLFGALISPTDPVAVLATFKYYKTPASLKARIAGESLFNDGVGIVLFLSAIGLLNPHTTATVGHVIYLFFRESVCGLFYGWLLGYVVGKLGGYTNHEETILMLTLMICTGGFVLANSLGFSGALAMVSAGMTVRYYLKTSDKSKKDLPTVDMVWEFIEDLLNAILFLLIGFELLTLHVTPLWLLLMFVMIAVVLVIRLLTVSPVIWFFHGRNKKNKLAFQKMVALFTWSGLRGGLAVALALSLPMSNERDLIISITYTVVAFAVIVQGFTIKPLIAFFKQKD